jgi:hypothetical protein
MGGFILGAMREESGRYKNMAAECEIKILVSQPVMMSH